MRRYTLSPAAARDLVQIWRYIKKESSRATADRVERVVREKIVMLSGAQGVGHRRADLTNVDVRFFPVYSYLIVYRPNTPLAGRGDTAGARDVTRILAQRFH